MKRLLTATIVAAAFASGAAFAQVGPYVGVSAGWSHYSIPDRVEELNNINICSALSCEKSDFGFKVFGGYMFTPYIGAEVQYANYGKATATVPGGELDLETAGFGAFLVGQYPIQDFRFFGKIGLAYLDSELSASAQGIGSDSYSDKATNFAWGVGATYMYNKNVGVRFEYEQSKWELSDTKDNVGLWSIGVQYSF